MKEAYYYELHIEIPKNGYSIGLESEIELKDDQEIINAAIQKGLFEEKDDHYCVDTIEHITKAEFIAWGYTPKI